MLLELVDNAAEQAQLKAEHTVTIEQSFVTNVYAILDM